MILFYFTGLVYFLLLFVASMGAWFACAGLLESGVRRMLRRARRLRPNEALPIYPLCNGRLELSLEWIVSLSTSFVICALWASTNYWLLINFLAFALAMMALEHAIVPGIRYTFLIGFILLGIIFYVIICFWGILNVFFSRSSK
jgi:hypothetical protein